MNPIRSSELQNNQLKELYNLCQNPNEANKMLNQYIGNNPMLKALANKGDYRALFEALCQSWGINPQDFINALKTKI